MLIDINLYAIRSYMVPVRTKHVILTISFRSIFVYNTRQYHSNIHALQTE